MRDERRRWSARGTHRALLLTAVACLLMGATAVRAQTGRGEGAWKYQLDVFGWGTGLSGTVGPSAKEYQVDATFSDLTKYLDFAAMGHFEAEKGRWGLMADLFYVNLGHSVDDSFGNPVKLNLEDMVLGLEGTYRIYGDSRSTFDVAFGARYNEIKTDVTPFLLPADHHSLSWTDPVLGFKGGVQMGKTWSFGYRTEVGGFGAGSDLSVLAALRFDARLSRSTSLGFGYALYKVDYETGSGDQTFVYDTTMQGPFLGVTFRW